MKDKKIVNIICDLCGVEPRCKGLPICENLKVAMKDIEEYYRDKFKQLYEKEAKMWSHTAQFRRVELLQEENERLRNREIDEGKMQEVILSLDINLPLGVSVVITQALANSKQLWLRCEK